MAWPHYEPDNDNCWPKNGAFNFQVQRDLRNFLQHNRKWSEVPYMQAFVNLQSKPSLCQPYSPCQSFSSKQNLPLFPPKNTFCLQLQADALLPLPPPTSLPPSPAHPLVPPSPSPSKKNLMPLPTYSPPQGDGRGKTHCLHSCATLPC